ncbi:MAG TPA: hypothetical protein VMW16_03040 [Sedimentisphaerales bacterium]|nr:hypothetical protein [Sedimentisphaerales bacterium]
MSPRKPDPKKQSNTIRIHSQVINKLQAAHPRYIAKTKKVISFTDFADTIILAGLESLFH